MTSNPVTVNLGDMAERAHGHVASGRYGSITEVVREGLRALEREDAALDAVMCAKVAEALADPRPAVPFDEAVASIWANIDRKRA